MEVAHLKCEEKRLEAEEKGAKLKEFSDAIANIDSK